MLYTYEILQPGDDYRKLYSVQATNSWEAERLAQSWCRGIEDSQKLEHNSVKFTLIKRHNRG